MLELANDLQTVKLTVCSASGTVWSMKGRSRPSSTGVGVSNFNVQSGSHVRIPGMVQNTMLILKMYMAERQDQSRQLEICSPWCCGPNGDRADPGVILYSSRNFEAPISVGGWRRFDSVDASTFALVGAFLFSHVKSNYEASMLDLLDGHPVSLVADWMKDLNRVNFCKLLGMIIDPRWFINPAEPDHSNKLRDFLGLEPDIQQVAVPTRKRAVRNRLVMSCWKTIPVPLTKDLRPDQFYWRSWHEKGGGWKGDLAASRRFISFLRQVWLMSICRGGLASELFVPDLFFRKPKESQAFKEFLKSHHGG